MSKTKKTTTTQSKAEVDAWAIAKGTQREGQTKEQTKLIAQGIKKGIELYKKEQSAKQRELDKQRKKEQRAQPQQADTQTIQVVYKQHWLPWGLLLLSWGGMVAYLLMGSAA